MSFLKLQFDGVMIKSNFSYYMTVLIFVFVLPGCSSKSESPSNNSSTKFKQYYIQGEQLYITNCSNCHQKTGTGLGLLYPPLKQSDFMANHFEQVICLIRNGKEGELIVNGKSYNQPMPAIPSLTDLEIAEVATYIYNSWENERGMIEVQDVSKILSTCDSIAP
jgi:mono/diheme cytochrome c family protein